MRNIVLIPLRGGSKGIKNKNLKLFNGKALCSYVIESSLNCEDIDETWVSTEDQKIKDFIKENHPKVKVFDRNPLFSTDTASTESVINEFLTIKSINKDYNIVLLQATSPLTSSFMITQAINQYKSNKLDSLLSVVRFKRFFWSDKGESINYDYKNRPRRQDFKGELMENGALYIFNVNGFISASNRLFGKIGTYIMPDNTAIELDEGNDWIILEKLA